MSDQNKVLHAVLGTAGHIDHGKSSLVRALTGTNPDRFKEEQDRGMTIDIGFAEYRTESGVDVGLIDVPGHERFVRNMVAGAVGMDMVMLVVAADDSVMPQTREHLEIMTLLGLKRGFVVITKVDVVDADLVDLVDMEVREFLEGTFLEDAPVIRCSSITGLGIDEVKAQIHSLVQSLPERDRGGVFRMPVQRSFTLKGHGTVVTGVPLSGETQVGEILELLPRGTACRVRGIHVHHRAEQTAYCGHRAALNLSDVDYREVHRGDVIAAKGFFSASKLVEARFTLLSSWPAPIRDNMPIRFHAGCSETLGRMVLLDAKNLSPGQDALVQLRLDEPVVVAPGDHYLVRLASPERTMGGGLVLGETRYRFKRFRDWIQENMQGKEQSLADKSRYLEYVVRSEGLHPVQTDRLPVLTKDAPQAVKDRLEELMTSGAVIPLPSGKEVLHQDMVARGAREATKTLENLHQEDHYPFGFALQTIASRMKHPPQVVRLFLDRAIELKTVEEQSKQYRLSSFKGNLSNEDRRIMGAVETRIRDAGWQAPTAKVLAEELGKPLKRVENILVLLEGWGRTVALSPGLHVHMDHVRSARELLVAHCLEHGEMPSNQMKDTIGATRKYVIPLLEYFDQVGLTLRVDSSRRLAEGYEQVLMEP